MLDLLDHLTRWNLIVEHVIDVVHAQRALGLRSAFRGLGIAHQVRELLVFDLYRADGVFGRGFVHRGDRDDLVARPMNGRIRTLDDMHGLHPRHLFGGAGIDAHHLRVRVGTAQNFAEEHSRALHVVRVFGLAGDLDRGVHARNTLAD